MRGGTAWVTVLRTVMATLELFPPGGSGPESTPVSHGPGTGLLDFHAVRKWHFASSLFVDACRQVHTLHPLVPLQLEQHSAALLQGKIVVSSCALKQVLPCEVPGHVAATDDGAVTTAEESTNASMKGVE